MPLNPSIPLSALGQQRPLDIVTPVVRGLQARRLQQQQQLGELELEAATRKATETRALSELMKRAGETGSFGSETFMREAARVAPTSYPAIHKMVTTQRTANIAAQKAQLELDMAKLNRAKSVMDFTGRLIGRVKTAPEDQKQEAYEQAIAEARDFYQANEFPTDSLDELPAIYDPAVINRLEQESLPLNQQIDFQVQLAQEKQQQLQAGEVETARLKAEATEPSRIRVAESRGRLGAERQAKAQVAAAKIKEETAAAIEAQKQKGQVLTGEAATKIGMLNALIRFGNELSKLFDPSFTGPIEGLSGEIAQFTGKISDDEVEFRRLSAGMKNYILNILSGAAINAQEAKRLARQVPSVYRQPNVYRRQLEGFMDELATIRDEKLTIATTPRGELKGQMVQPFTRSTAAPVPTTAEKVVTPADIDATMRNPRMQGKTRDEVIQLFIDKGYRIEGQ